jgi:hypothetical protein
MNFISAVCKHAWLAIRLKHNGAGMPTKIPAAAALVSLYIALTLANKSRQEIDWQVIFGLCFVAQFYVFTLRNRLIGLIITIGIITNFTSFILSILTGIPPQQLLIVTLLEYVMIFCAMINVIKSNIRTY